MSLFFKPPAARDPSPGTPPIPAIVHPFVCLAREAIRVYLEEARSITPIDSLLDEFEILRAQAGVFVTLMKYKELRGCMGTIEPAQANVALEIIENAITAGFQDPRFPRLMREELAQLDVSVDILKPAQQIGGILDLDPVRYGVIVRQGERRGLLLPGIEEITSPEEQVAIACRKGGITADGPFELYRFEVDRYH